MNHFHIAGAGIAGVAAAIALVRNGNGITLLEQAPQFSDIGAGLQLGPNAVRALQKIGAWDAVAPLASSPPEIIMRDGKSGKILKSISQEGQFQKRFGVPYRVIHRADLHKALLTVLQSNQNLELMTDAKVISALHSGRNVRINLANGSSLYAEILLAADGVNSGIRQSIFADSAAVSLPSNVLRLLINKPQDDSNIAWEAVNLWLCPYGHVVHYPIGNQINLVVVNDRANYDGWFPPLRHFLESQRDYSKWSAQFVKPLKKWHQGLIGLIGDAAHGTVPYLAQGAAQSLEDAACLAQMPHKNSAQQMFEKLYEVRSAKASTVHNLSLGAGKTYHLTGMFAAARNLVISNMGGNQFLDQLAKIYGP